MRSTPRQTVRDGYDTVAASYLAARPDTGGDLALLPELLRHLECGDAVLDAGCGAGAPVMAQLSDAGLQPVGLDISMAQLRLARARRAMTNVAEGDLAALPFRDGVFDGLVSFYAVIHVPRADHSVVFSEFWRVLRSGGVALLCVGSDDLPEDHDPASWLGVPMFWSHFDAATNLAMLAAAGFEILEDWIVADPMEHARHLFVLVTRS